MFGLLRGISAPAVAFDLPAPTIDDDPYGFVSVDKDGGTAITGTAYPGSTVTVAITGAAALTDVAGVDGAWSVTAPARAVGTYAATAVQQYNIYTSPALAFDVVSVDTAVWLLAGGVWNDLAVWDDAAVWVD